MKRIDRIYGYIRQKSQGYTKAQLKGHVGVTASELARTPAKYFRFVHLCDGPAGKDGDPGTPGGGGGPKGIVSKEVSDYYYKVEAYLKRRWEQPSVYGDSRPKAGAS